MIRLLLILGGLSFLAGGAIAQSSDPGKWPSPIVADSRLAARRELLLSHGVVPDSDALVQFLENGFDEKAVPGGLPERPFLKTEVVNAAIEELGATAATAGVAVLQRIVRRELPAGVDKILRRDFESVPVQVRDEQMRTARRMLSLNAITALGLIGDESAAPTIIEVMQTETATAFVTKGAIALGQMGRNDGLGPLIALAARIESEDSVAAFQTVYILTGRNYGYTTYSSLARRRQLVAELEDWYVRDGQSTPLYRTEILRRQQAPFPGDMADPSSLRGLLRASRDLTNYDRRYAAREKLEELVAGGYEELRAIAEDPMEDLDIRRSAMTWLAATDPRKARPVIRDLRKDENPYISDFADSLTSDIDEAIAYEKESRRD